MMMNHRPNTLPLLFFHCEFSVILSRELEIRFCPLFIELQDKEPVSVMNVIPGEISGTLPFHLDNGMIAA
jgi:hypothetical protein